MLAAVTLFLVLRRGHMTKKMLLNRAAEHIRFHFFTLPTQLTQVLHLEYVRPQEYGKRSLSCSLVLAAYLHFVHLTGKLLLLAGFEGLRYNYSVDTKGGLEAITQLS